MSTGKITKPGVYQVDELDYHRDTAISPAFGPSLSNTGMKTLLDCPARFKHEAENGREPKPAFDLGGTVHELVLRGGDSRIRVIDAYDWRTKAAQEARKAAHQDRLTPINRAELLQATRIARAVKRHPKAAELFSEGEPEKSVYWVDKETGVTCRARIDWVRKDCLVDFKTARYGHANPEVFARDCARFEYPMQQAHYSEGWESVTGERLPFYFVVVETSAPFLVSVVRIEDYDLVPAQEKVARARRLFVESRQSGSWSGYGEEVQTLSMPAWYADTEYDEMSI